MTIRRCTTLTLTVATIGVLLQACGPRSGGPATRLFASDFQGVSRTCDAPKVTPAAGKTTEATMKVGSAAGWCGLTLNNGGRPFDSELLTARPAHGKVFVHSVGNDTRIDYTPDKGFTGADSFAVQLLPGDGTVHVTVTAVAN